MAPTLTLRQLKDVPAVRQTFSLVLVAAAVAGGIAVYMWSQAPGFTPLYSNLGNREAAEIAEALRAAAIPYEVDTASGVIGVPADKLHEARLGLAAKGLPSGGAKGFELIEQEQGFGTSQMIEGARYQHALETELARTIASLQPVAAARVHLALPKASAFSRSENSATASVMVELRGGRTLEPEQVASIVHLVAASIPGLDPQSVSVIDQGGRLLTRPA
jgi:flagellar M-ring protein FliF